jgi:hypothetical protein
MRSVLSCLRRGEFVKDAPGALVQQSLEADIVARAGSPRGHHRRKAASKGERRVDGGVDALGAVCLYHTQSSAVSEKSGHHAVGVRALCEPWRFASAQRLAATRAIASSNEPCLCTRCSSCTAASHRLRAASVEPMSHTIDEQPRASGSQPNGE